MRRQTIVTLLAAGALCAGTLTTVGLRAQVAPKTKASGKMEMMSKASPVTKAIAVLHATKSGGEASGTVTFTQVEGGIKVEAEIRGLKPGQHGFHVHEFGDVHSDDAMSAGSHFDPDMTKHHGRPADTTRHVGDLGNLEANARGVAKLELVDPVISFSGPHSIIGRAVIVHADPDNFGQPVGNAGGRVASGVVGIAKPD
jgi:Cu-Zn family superoxide dismutase